MRSLASLVSGFIFGLGLFISGMIRPDKVLGFLDVLAIPSGNWDPSLAIVMATALAVTALGYAFARRRVPLFAAENQWPTQKLIDRPLVVGSVLFGIGWGLVGLCPGPAIENLATLSPTVVVFVVALAIGTLAHDLWPLRRLTAGATLASAATGADG
jgi:uncharacterized protein